MTQVGSHHSELTIQAERGEIGAQYSLGVLFLLGEGVKQDLEIAYHWLSRAASENKAAQSLVAKVAVFHQPIRKELRRQFAFGILTKTSGLQTAWRDSRELVRAKASRAISRFESIWRLGLRLRGRSLSEEPVFEGRRRHAPFVDPA